MVDDNFHYMDEDERYQAGEFDTPQEAINLCKEIVEASIQYEDGKSPEELFATYCMFGEAPFIIGDVSFSGREYAKEYIKQLFQKAI